MNEILKRLMWKAKTFPHCSICGLPDCAWQAGPTCEGEARIRAFGGFAPADHGVRWPFGLRWLARKLSRQLVELESINEYWCKIAKEQFEDIRLVDVKIKPDEFKVLLRSGIGGILVSWMLQSMRAIGATSYVEVRGQHPAVGEITVTVATVSGEAPGARAARYEDIIRSYVTPRPVDDWHEDYGACLFWTLDENGNPTEPPYAGTPNDMRPMHLVDGRIKVDVDGVLTGDAESGGKIHTIEACPFPVYATHFTRIPEASLQWKPPAPPPIIYDYK
jgi:hypothetical protein